MATVKPFRALRPVAAVAAEFASLPYDVMDTAEAREMVVTRAKITRRRMFQRLERVGIPEIRSYPLIYDGRTPSASQPVAGNGGAPARVGGDQKEGPWRSRSVSATCSARARSRRRPRRPP